MKKNTVYVAKEKFLALAERLGVQRVDQKGWIKFIGPTEGKAVYVANTKMVGAVDISGFSVDLEGREELAIVPHSAPPTKRVLQMIDFTRPEAETLLAFGTALKALLDPAITAVARTAGEPPSSEEVDRAVNQVLSAVDE